MMSTFGLLLIPFVAAVTLLSGVPVYVALLAGTVIGAAGGLAAGTITPGILQSVVPRLINLLESDILQALPLFVLMGVLLNRLPAVGAVFRCSAWLLRLSPAAPIASGFALGALLGPMSGSVGASVTALARAVDPPLVKAEVPAATRGAVVAVAGTLGVVVPPSLVLILLGDAMLYAHNFSINVTGRPDRVINTQDLMRGALVPAALFLAVCLAIAVWSGRAGHADAPRPTKPLAHGVLIALATIASLLALLGGVATGRFYAVEAAACGCVALLSWFVVSGAARNGGLAAVADRVMVETGALFAPLVAATSFTLVLRLLGSDKLIEAWIAALPGGEMVAIAVILGALAVLALALDAFEIIFVAVPILVPALLIKVSDAVWVGVLVLLVIQASFLLPPIGYAWVLSRSSIEAPAPAGQAFWAIAPYLAGQLAVVALVLAMPALVHMLDPPGSRERGPPAGAAPASADEMLRQLPPAPSIGGLPPFQLELPQPAPSQR